jgi:hypothetical protein
VLLMMRAWRTVVRMAVAALAGVAVIIGLNAPAQAFPGPPDDRMISTPTAWWIYPSVDAATVTKTVNDNGARITDLRVVSTSPLRFSVTEVSNTGAYASRWWWFYGVSMSQVNGLLSANGARLISAVRYGSVYAVVMVPNSGANYKAWGWCDTDVVGVSICLGATNRLTNIEGYAPGRFVAIFVDNNEGYFWCWYPGISRAALNNVCGHESLLDVSPNADGTFAVAAIFQNGDGQVASFDTPDQLIQYAVSAPPFRPLFVAPYVAGGVTRWITAFRHNE